MQRGIIISPPMVARPGVLMLRHADIDAQELRHYLLFWDKLNYPENNAIGIGLGQDTQFLFDLGILSRERVVFDGPVELGDAIRRAHVSAFEKLDREQPGMWCVATGPNSVVFPNDDLEHGRGVLFSIHRSLPVPDKDVPLDDILKFKERRNAELQALRVHLDSIYIRIIDSPDKAVSESVEFQNLDKAIADYIKATKGFGLSFRLASHDVHYSIGAKWPPSPVGGAIVGAASMVAFGLDAAQAALAGAFGSAIDASLSIKGGAALKMRKDLRGPYQYIASYHRELF